MTTRRMSLAQRFDPKVDRSAGTHGCHEWRASTTVHGYGKICAGGRRGSTLHAHRVAWELAYGPVPSGLYVCHRCDNRLCCNPAHLFLGSAQDNTSDAKAKGRLATGERHGHSVLSARQAIEIRCCVGVITQRALAAIYGVSQTAISRIAVDETWRARQ